jgi:vacuolar-type H+-ATPase subunit I/STV1
MVDKKKKFGYELIKFYKGFLLGSSDAVKTLAKIEKNYPKEYMILKELKDDPKAIIQLSNKLPDNVRNVLFSIIIESSTFGERMNRLFDLTQKQKEDLAKEIDDFAERVEKELNELEEILKGEK